MLIEIKGVGFKNKGAELMFHAIIQKMGLEFPGADFVMRPKGDAPYKKRAEFGIYQKLDFSKYGINFGRLIGNVLHKKVKKYYGLISEEEIDVVLDASGLGYSDKWGLNAVKRAATDYKRAKENGAKIIMLPQAFGPFNTPGFTKNLKVMHKYTDLIYAREEKSFEYISKAVGTEEKIKIAPDFTNLLEPQINERAQDQSGSICIIPNYRMIDKTDDHISNNYIPFMVSLIRELKNRGEEVFLLIHEGKSDVSLSKEIVNNLGFDIEIVQEDNPLIIKGIISKSKGVVSSRFHGLANALSTGVPSLATGWSHKYKLLFDDYGFDNGMLEVDMPFKEMQAKLDYLTEDKKNKDFLKLLYKKSEELKEITRKMWFEVIELIKS